MYNDMELVKASALLSATTLGYSTIKKRSKLFVRKTLIHVHACIHNHFFVSVSHFSVPTFSMTRSYCTGMVHNACATCFCPASISPAEHVHEFPNEALTVTVSAGKLFCSVRREVSLKRSIIKSHIKSAKQQRGQTAVARKQAREKDIVEALKDYDKQSHPAGETLLEPQRVFRVKVVMSFLYNCCIVSISSILEHN